MNEKAEKKQSRKFALLIGIIILLLLVIVALLIKIISDNKESGINVPNISGQQAVPTAPTVSTAPVEKLTDSISLPGYGGLNLEAGIKEQNLFLPNPAENFCQIRISLILEDDTVIWTSELVKPGEFAQVVLNEALEAGEYNAILRYECFQMDQNQTPLNGATTQLVLHIH